MKRQDLHAVRFPSAQDAAIDPASDGDDYSEIDTDYEDDEFDDFEVSAVEAVETTFNRSLTL